MQKKRWVLSTVLVACLAGITFLSLRKVDSDPTRNIDQFLSDLYKHNKFNGTVLVARSGKILLEKGYGTRRADENIAHDANSVFRIYSITKSFTSTLVMQMVAEGKLSLTDRLSQFYPRIVNADQITIEHLLNHSSGLYDYTREIHFENSESNLTKLLELKPSDFSPGSSWSYCNSGYCLLGHIIEKVTGHSYSDNLHSRIFEPLGMTKSGFNFESLNGPDIATGYRQFTRASNLASRIMRSSEPFAAGGIHATASDLYRFHIGLKEHRLMTDDAFRHASTGCASNANYGLGWQVQTKGSPFGRQTRIGHGGGADGFRTNFSQDSQFDRCVIVLSNLESVNADFVSDSIHRILDGEKITIPQTVEVPKSQLQCYLGVFMTEGDQPLLMKTSIIDNLLAAEIIGQPPSTLLAKSPDTFFNLKPMRT